MMNKKCLDIIILVKEPETVGRYGVMVEQIGKIAVGIFREFLFFVVSEDTLTNRPLKFTLI